ncbi:MAG: GGDEF domain-containing protein, partial [Pseudomonas sp.]|nr:GGDEF domain-containing protein [Pseudomonas sp.]
MIAHTPTIFASVAWVAMIMAFCLLVVGRFNQRDGMLTVGAGLLAHALAYVCFTLFGHASL